MRLCAPAALLVVLCAGAPARAASSGTALGLAEVLKAAQEHSPQFRAALLRAEAVRSEKTAVRSALLPRVDAAAIDSSGFPGSSGLTGVAGLMGSPYRKGPALGLSSQWTLTDFGRTGHLALAADGDRAAAQEGAKLERMQAELEALRDYFAAVRYRSQAETLGRLRGEIDYVAREVDRYVRTGQRSVVERLLAQDQVEEADAEAAADRERYRAALDELALATGLERSSMECPAVESVDEKAWEGLRREPSSPLIGAPLAQAQAAKERAQAAREESLPSVVAVGSLGALSDVRLAGKKDYALGVGVTLPLFSGYRISADEARAAELARAGEEDAAGARLRLRQADAGYEGAIRSSKVKLDLLKKELVSAEEAFALAKKRYFAFQGTLVDVREALRNVSRVRTAINDLKVDLLLLESSQAVVDGAYAP